MKTRNLILLTLSIPFVFFLLWYSIKLRPLPVYGQNISYTSENFTYYGEDGTLLPGEILIPQEKLKSYYYIFSADKNLDRYWNSKNSDFQTGKFLAHILASNGIPAVIFDQRGSGKSVTSGRNLSSISNLSDDLNTIYSKVKTHKALSGKKLRFLSHGHGCSAAMNAAVKFSMKPEQMILIACAYEGTLLEDWMSQIQNNMQRSGVSKDTVERAEKIMRDFNSGKIRDLAGQYDPEKENPDIISVYRALEYLSGPDMNSWTKDARQTSLTDLIKKLITNTKITHLLLEFDEEMTPATRSAWETHIKKHPFGINYSFEIFRSADHFLYKTDSFPSGVLHLSLRRMNPVRELNRELLERIIKE